MYWLKWTLLSFILWTKPPPRPPNYVVSVGKSKKKLRTVFWQFWAKKISIQNGKKTLHKILTVSKPSHSEVSLIHVAKIDFGKTGEVEDITKKEKGIASCEFPKEKYNPESGTQCVRPFPIWKNKLLLMNI